MGGGGAAAPEEGALLAAVAHQQLAALQLRSKESNVSGGGVAASRQGSRQASRAGRPASRHLKGGGQGDDQRGDHALQGGKQA